MVKKKFNLFKKVNNAIKKAVTGLDFDKYADDTALQIKKRTRLGHGVTDGERGGKKYALKEVSRSEKYNKYRKKSKKLNKSVTTPAKNNLTLTGQLLDSMVGKSSGTKIIVELQDKRSDKVKNTDIRDYQEDLGRYFFELTDKEVKGLRNSIKKDLIKKFKKTRQ